MFTLLTNQALRKAKFIQEHPAGYRNRATLRRMKFGRVPFTELERWRRRMRGKSKRALELAMAYSRALRCDP